MGAARLAVAWRATFAHGVCDAMYSYRCRRNVTLNNLDVYRVRVERLGLGWRDVHINYLNGALLLL